MASFDVWGMVDGCWGSGRGVFLVWRVLLFVCLLDLLAVVTVDFFGACFFFFCLERLFFVKRCCGGCLDVSSFFLGGGPVLVAKP